MEIMNKTFDSQEMCKAKSIAYTTKDEGSDEKLKSKLEADICDYDDHDARETQPLLPKPDSSSTDHTQPHSDLTSSTYPSSRSESTSSPAHNLTTTSSSTDGCTSGSSTSSLNSTYQSSGILLRKNHFTVGVGSQSSQSPNNHNYLHNDVSLIRNPEELTASRQSHAQLLGDSSVSKVLPFVPTAVKANDNISSSTSNRATSMRHVKAKYMSELDYMLREFKKLERQLSGAKACINGVQESIGSRERREKLHSFILHLEDTIRQVENGCIRENESDGGGQNSLKTDVSMANHNNDDANLTASANTENRDNSHSKNVGHSVETNDERKHAEAVIKLDDHIRINLLPVKVRLSNQLAAQLGANQNPVGIPVARSGLPSIKVGDKVKGTFAAAAEQKRLTQMKLQQQQQQQQQSERTTLSSTTSSTTNTATNINNNAADNHTQFGKPLGSAGSSLTHKLHGETLGSESRPYGYGVGSKVVTDIASSSMDIQEGMSSSRKRMVAGVAPGSDPSQMISTVSSVASAHRNFFENPTLGSVPSPIAKHTLSSLQIPLPKLPGTASSLNPPNAVANPLNPLYATSNPSVGDGVENIETMKSDRDCMLGAATQEDLNDSTHTSVVSMTLVPRSPKKSLSDPTLTLEERAEIIRRRLQKKKRRLMCEQQPHHEMEEQIMNLHSGEINNLVSDGVDSIIGSSSNPSKKSTKTGSLPSSRTMNINRNGPKAVEYLCAMCNETYASSCDSNPWWTLNTQECPKCLKIQIPRIDISSPANEIEYHPALLVQAAEDNNVSLATSAEKMNSSLSSQIKEQSISPNASHAIYLATKISTTGIECKKEVENDQDTASDLEFGPIDGDDLSTSESESESDFGENMSLAARAEHEEFGKEYSGPKFTDYDSSRLLILMSHASTCPGLHKNPRTLNICRNIKLLMLHVRDCPGTTFCSDICPFPWCRKTKHLLYHLVSCSVPEGCDICSRTDMPISLKALKGLSEYRARKRLHRSQSKSVGAITSPMTSENLVINHSL